LNRRVSTGEAILRHCDKHNIPHRIVTLDATNTSDRAVEASIPAPTLHFLTPPSAPANETGSTLVYFHGGGFVNPLRGAAHMPFIMRCAGACRAKQVVILEYALAPEHPYPAQLVQCVATLRYLLDEMGLRPDDLVLAGDSAGGQLVGALLAHLVKPSPYAAPIKLDGQFWAALFVSLFVRLREGAGSYDTNDGRDYLSRSQVDGFMSAWKANGGEIWADLCGADGSGDVWRHVFARGSQGLVRKAMVAVGTADILLDSCRVFGKEHVQAETVLAGRHTDYRVFEGKDMVLAECEGEVHVQVALDSVVGYKKGSMEHAIMSWLAHL
jgi:acetyl esterase/lipase